MSANYQGVITFYNGFDAEQRVPFLSCSLQRVDSYNYSTPIVQRGVLNYSLGNMRFEGDLNIPLFDRLFTPLFRWILNSSIATITVTYNSGLSHVYQNCRARKASINSSPGGLTTLNISINSTYRVVYATSYTTPIGPSAFPINDHVSFYETCLSGGGITSSEVNGFDINLDNNVQEIFTANTWPYSRDLVPAWYRRPYVTLPGGLTVTGSVHFLNPQNNLTSGGVVSATLGSNVLYLTRILWQSGGLVLNNPNQRLKITVPFQSLASNQYFAAHV